MLRKIGKMNTLELAENISLDNCHLDHADRLSIATMLRQQQAENEDTKRKWLEAIDGLLEMKQRNEQLQAEIESLKKAKTLTDEEIDEIWNPNCPPYALTMTEIRDFARAILRKANEK